MDPTNIHIYKSNFCDENEEWQHVPFAEREKEIAMTTLPKESSKPKEESSKKAPYYRKFMSTPKPGVGSTAKAGPAGPKATSM